MSNWVETATAVAIRLVAFDQLDIIAPFGLQDLFEFKLRWNTKLVSRTTFQNRIESKQWLLRWSKLRVIES